MTHYNIHKQTTFSARQCEPWYTSHTTNDIEKVTCDKCNEILEKKGFK